MIPLRVIITAHGNLDQAARIFDAEFNKGLRSAGRTLRRAVQGNLRKDTRDAERGVKVELQETDKGRQAFVYGELIQHVIDELGLPPGTFAPWNANTRLYHWVERKALHLSLPAIGDQRPGRAISHLRRSRNARRGRQYRQRKRGLARPLQRRSKTQRAALHKNAKERSRTNNIRRAAFLVARAIYESGIKPEMPFSRALIDNRDAVIKALTDAIERAVYRINQG